MNVQRLVYFLFVFLFCLHFSTLLCTAEDEAEELDEDELTVQRWVDTFQKIKKMIGSGIKFAMPQIMSSMSDKDLNMSQECRRALFLWIADMRSMKPWALRGKQTNISIFFQYFNLFTSCRTESSVFYLKSIFYKIFYFIVL